MCLIFMRMRQLPNTGSQEQDGLQLLRRKVCRRAQEPQYTDVPALQRGADHRNDRQRTSALSFLATIKVQKSSREAVIVEYLLYSRTWFSIAIDAQGVAKNKIFAFVEAVGTCHGCPGLGAALTAIDTTITAVNSGSGTNKKAKARSLGDGIYAVATF